MAEQWAYAETGHILSEEARETYFSSGSNLGLAYLNAAVTHQRWNNYWGNEITHAQAHGAFGQEMKVFTGWNRTFVSVTTKLERARYFAGGGKVYSAIVPRWEMIPQTLGGANEGEWLIRLGRAGFSEY